MTEKRPAWAKDGEMQEYYDHYWGIPVHNEHDLFRMLVLESFQAGLSWSTVWKKRHAFDQAFDDFDVEKMAALTAVDVDKLMGNPDIIRNRRKIEAAIHNAQVLRSYHQEGKTLEHFIWSFVDGTPIQVHAQTDTVLPSTTPLAKKVAKQMKKAGFKFVGPVTIYSWMCAVGVVNARVE